METVVLPGSVPSQQLIHSTRRAPCPHPISIEGPTQADLFPLLALPVELRLEVYEQLRQQIETLPISAQAQAKGLVLRTSKRICSEALPILYPKHTVTFNAECCKNESGTLLHLPEYARKLIRHLKIQSYHDDLAFDMAETKLWAPHIRSLSSLRRFDWTVEALPFINFCWTLLSLGHNVKRDSERYTLSTTLTVKSRSAEDLEWREAPHFADEDVLDIFPPGIEIHLRRSVTELECQQIEEYQSTGWAFQLVKGEVGHDDSCKQYKWSSIHRRFSNEQEEEETAKDDKIRMFRNVNNS